MDKHIDLSAISALYNTPEKARAFFEATRWPNGAICPHCGCINAKPVGSFRKKRTGSKANRPGLWYCLECRDQFTVLEGTIMEASKIPLHKWLLAFYMLGASKKGVSAHQLHRTLGISYKAAWFMAHRIRFAMAQEPLKSRLSGTGPAKRQRREQMTEPLPTPSRGLLDRLARFYGYESFAKVPASKYALLYEAARNTESAHIKRIAEKGGGWFCSTCGRETGYVMKHLRSDGHDLRKVEPA